MNHIIIGTAGHIDHGKTALVKALTGQDADRLPEEKERGITIDLGYAWRDLGTIRAGFIDVPGHEKLIANMVSGVTGMDMVLFTVAADEGMKPQSFEHLDIMDILGVRRGIVVITKADLADNDRIDIVREQIRQETVHTFLENAPVISTSIKTSEGIGELRQALQEMAEDIVHKRCKDTDQDGFVQEHGFPRLPVDRVFTLKGFGTVVTGTLISGYLNKDSKLAIYPRELPCKIRSIQSYGQDVAKAQAGQRCALNLPGIKTDQVSRGDVIAPPGALHATLIMNVKLQVTKRFSRELENGMRAHLLIGTRRVLCRIYRFDDCYAQLRLEEPVCVLENVSDARRSGSLVYAIGNDGALWRLAGFGEQDKRILTDPQPEKLLDGVQAVSGCLALKKDGSVWSLAGETPEKMLDDGAYIHSNAAACAAVRENGELWCWGTLHRPGNVQDTITLDAPTLCCEDVKEAACCYDGVLILKTDGTLLTLRYEDGELQLFPVA